MQSVIRPAKRLVQQNLELIRTSVPVFLCHGLLRTPYAAPLQLNLSNVRRSFRTSGRRRSTRVPTEIESKISQDEISLEHIRALPPQCPGCGARTQVLSSGVAGYYDLRRKAVHSYVNPQPPKNPAEEEIYKGALATADPELLKGLGLSPDVAIETKSQKTPVCDRCHNLIHHHEGIPIYHPSLDSIQATIEASPYDRNHIYHVLDAADFPMSLIPRLEQTLDLAPLRSRNRRSKHEKYRHGRIAEVSFIITRSDLLAPLKEQVDALMPYMRSVLKETIERKARREVRLGNVHMVSAQRGWWTKGLKERIWQRGGAGWMVGKVNVGKSNLFQVILPKGRGQSAKDQSTILMQQSVSTLESADDLLLASGQQNAPESDDTHKMEGTQDIRDDEMLSDDNALLPPAQKEVAYPDMPTVSDLPGTTAAPIRIPFGDGRGELIDLPGLFRSDIENYVLPEHRFDLVMKHRIAPEKIVIKEDKSLLLGNLIRITPKTSDIFIAHPFLTLKPHLTSTTKAIDIHNGTISKNIDSIVTPEACTSMRSAGTFKLKWDVTKAFTGSLTRRDAGKVRTSQLPFVVLSTDILIEGLGWVELIAQVRKRRLEDSLDTFDPSEAYPEVEVFSPEGRFIAQRRPMGASVLGGKKVIPKHKRRARPRMSMRSVKARRKPKSELATAEDQ